ncbi:MAG: TnpV protein [Clostridia bacterium]|nr:TnpV protein [Clostridia bacterium]
MASYYEQLGGTYTAVGGVQLPNLVLDAPPPGTLGKYGRMRKRYLEQKHDGTFSTLVLSGALTQHLLDVDQAARDQMASLIPQLAATEGVTESLKARDPLAWVRHMNSIRNQAEEMVKNDLINR